MMNNIELFSKLKKNSFEVIIRNYDDTFKRKAYSLVKANSAYIIKLFI